MTYLLRRFTGSRFSMFGDSLVRRTDSDDIPSQCSATDAIGGLLSILILHWLFQLTTYGPSPSHLYASTGMTRVHQGGMSPHTSSIYLLCPVSRAYCFQLWAAACSNLKIVGSPYSRGGRRVHPTAQMPQTLLPLLRWYKALTNKLYACPPSSPVASVFRVVLSSLNHLYFASVIMYITPTILTAAFGLATNLTVDYIVVGGGIAG